MCQVYAVGRCYSNKLRRDLAPIDLSTCPVCAFTRITTRSHMLAGFGSRFLKNLFCYLRARILHFDVKGAAYQKISQTLPESDESVDVKDSMGDNDRKCAA